MAIHHPGIENIDTPALFIFPELVLCLVCGFAEFSVNKNELRFLQKGKAASG